MQNAQHGMALQVEGDVYSSNYQDAAPPSISSTPPATTSATNPQTSVETPSFAFSNPPPETYVENYSFAFSNGLA